MAQILAGPEPNEGLRVLCLDGPPIAAAALSEPLFLQEIAHRWAFDRINGEDVHVSDMFDIIGGCGIGGLYAILFARLNMTIRQVIEFHNSLQEKLFSADCWARKDQKACARAFDEILNQLVHSGITLDLDLTFLSGDCKCYILLLNNMKATTLLPRALRNYKVRTGSTPACTIRQALHATLSDLEHLPAESIGDQQFYDASGNFPNASHRLVKELAASFPKQYLSCFVNLGADSTVPENHSYIVSQDLMVQFKDLRCFFRLSVREELHAESRTKGSFRDFFSFGQRSMGGSFSGEDQVKSVVSGYLQEEGVSNAVDEIVEALKGRKQVVKMLRLGNLAGEDGKTKLMKNLSQLRDGEEIRRAFEKIRAPDTFRSIREYGCLDGTREDILRPIEDWVEDVDDDSPNVFWLDGYPGTGKTAICISLKQRLAELGYLGASCFFRREDASQHSLSAVFRSIALQLADNHRSIRDNIVQVTNSGAVHLESTPSIVFEKLICGPLSAASIDFNGPIVLVLDAMDEFGRSDQDKLSLVKLLLSRWIQLPRCCKLFIASRSQGDLPRLLNVPEHMIRQLEVGTATSAETKGDIRKFLEHNFEEIRNNYGNTPAFLTSLDLDELVAASAGLFIWASTVIEMVRHMRKHVRQILQDLRERGTTIGTTRMDALHQLYSIILQPLVDDERSIIRFLSIVICTRTPLPATTLSPLCDLHVDIIEDTARHLGPVMDTSSGLRFVHKSFVDYVLSQYCPVQLSINSGELMLAESCFEVMYDQLHFNMAKMQSSYMLNREVPNLHGALSEELRYASRFWGTHLTHLLKESKDMMMTLPQRIGDFLEHRFLYWLEAVSILECFQEALDALSTVKVAGLGKALGDFAQDALAFLRQFALPISQSYPHIYLSAVPWTPSTSLIRARYVDAVPHVLSVISNGDEAWPTQLAVLQGHKNSVHCVAFSPDSTQIVSGSYDKTVRIWDAATRQPVGEPLRGHNDSVTCVAFSPDSSQIVSGSYDSTIRIWDAAIHQPVGEPLRGRGGEVSCVAFSPDGSQIASGFADKTVRIWDTATRQPVGEPLRGHGGWVTSVVFSPDGSQIVSGSNDTTIRIWDTATRQPAGEPLRGHDDRVSSVAFSPDGSQIVSGSRDKTIRIWDAATRQPVGEPLRGPHNWVYSVAFSPDGSQIVGGFDNTNVWIWDTATHKTAGEPLQGHSASIYSVAFSPDGSQIVSGCGDGTVRIWDAVTRQPVGELLRGHDSRLCSVAFSPDSSQTTSGSDDNTVRIWDATTRQPVGKLLRGRGGEVSCVAFSPNGSQIVSGFADKTVRIWDAATRQPVGEPLRGHNDQVRFVAFSPNGSQVVSGSNDNTVRIWDAAIRQPVGEPLRGHSDWVRCVTFSPDGSQIASGSADKTVRIWDAATRQPVGEPLRGHGSWVTSVVFSPDGSQIVSGSNDTTIRIWDTATRQPAGEPLRGHDDRVSSIAFSPDGSQIVSGSDDKTVRIWDAATRQPVGEPLRGHDGWVTSVVFSPYGSQIVSGSDDTTIRTWDTATRQPVGEPLRGHDDRVNSVAFSPDGSQVVSGSDDKTIRIWDAATRQPVEEPLRGPHSWVYSIAFSPDRSQMVSGSADKTIQIWDSATRQPVAERLRILKTLSFPRVSHALSLQCFLLHDGWVIDQCNCRLVWIPQHLHQFLPSPGLVDIIGTQRMVVVDTSNMKTGIEWSSCFSVS